MVATAASIAALLGAATVGSAQAAPRTGALSAACATAVRAADSADMAYATCQNWSAATAEADAATAAPTSASASTEPAYCSVSTSEGKIFETRYNACGTYLGTLDVIDAKTREVVGALTFTAQMFVQSSKSSGEWTFDLTVRKETSWGAAKGTVLTGGASCSAGCSVASGSFGTQPIDLRGVASAQWTMRTRLAAAPTGRVLSGTATASLRFQPPDALPSTLAKVPTPTVRCDNKFARTIGCVLPDVAPVLIYSLSGPYPQLAAHIRDAQSLGLPGKWDTSSYLTRLVNPTLQDKNRGKACPTNLTRPPGDSCDEYPFASTYQGAYTGGGKFSRRMINATQNSDGGVELGVFYNYNRIYDGDRFQVYIAA